MADDYERRIAKRLQKLVDEEWPEPRAISLDGPGPFELPLCVKPSILTQGSAEQIVLLLETAKQSQRVRIPIQTDDLGSLVRLLEAAQNALKPR